MTPHELTAPPLEDGEIPLILPEDEAEEDCWVEVHDLTSEDIPIAPDERSEELASWAPVPDAEAPDFNLGLDPSDDLTDPWALLTDRGAEELGLPAEPSRDLPPLLSGRDLLASASNSPALSPPVALPWRGLFEAEEFIGLALPYRVSFEQLASELHVAEWSWLAEPEQQKEGRLKLRLEASGVDFEVEAGGGHSPRLSLRGFLGARELRFDVLVVTGTRPGLLLGRDVLAEGFLVDPATPESGEH